MRTPRHPTSDEMDRLIRQARTERSEALFTLCARLWNWIGGRKATPVTAKFA